MGVCVRERDDKWSMLEDLTDNVTGSLLFEEREDEPVIHLSLQARRTTSRNVGAKTSASNDDIKVCEHS